MYGITERPRSTAFLASMPAKHRIRQVLGQLSLPSLRGRTSLHWLGLRRGVFASVGWQVILCDPIWQATPCSSEMDFQYELMLSLLFYGRV